MEISILDYFTEDNISLDIKSAEKVSSIREMVELASESGRVLDKETFFQSLLDREGNGTTGIGNGIAIPHARTHTVDGIAMSLGISKSGVDYNALDKKPVHILFLIAAPVSQSTEILMLIAKICRFLNSDNFRKGLLKAKTKKDIIELFKNRK